MTHERDIERILDHWFADGPNEAPDRVFEVVADRIERQSQRPSWRLSRREPHMNTYLKSMAAVAAIFVVVVVGYKLLPASSSGVGADGAAPSIDGIWTTTFTKAELIASPLLTDDGEVNDGNWGDWTMTFENGQVSYTQRNNVLSSSSSGTYTINGDVVTLSFDRGANTGETFEYRWSLSQDSLSFKRDDSLGWPGPTPWLLKAWTRTP